MDRYFLHKDIGLFLVIDIQDRLAQVMSMREGVIANTLHMLHISRLMDIPVVVTEQYPKGLGITVDKIREHIPEYMPLEKMSFDCCNEPLIVDRLKLLGRSHIIIAGMETHICVLQTTLSLLRMGYNVHLLSDAVCSRSKHNWKTGIEIMRDAGAVITSTETVLFQLLRQAGTEEFKTISKRIK